MIKPELKSLSSTRFDVAAGPKDGNRFCEWLTVEVEARDGARIYGGEEFSVGVCSTIWLAQEVARLGGKWGHGYLVVPRWDLVLITTRVSELCEASAAEGWGEVVRTLSRYMQVDMIDFAPRE